MGESCPSCSAPLPARGVVCRYCGSRRDLDLQGWRHLQASAPDGPLQCPDGHGNLEWLELPPPGGAGAPPGESPGEPPLQLGRCPSCLGLFLPLGTLERLLDQAVGPVWAIDPQLLQTLADSPRAEASSWRYRPCPSCGELMHRQLHGQRSGVVVDRCRDHGLWLDAGELRQLLEWTRAGGQLLEQQRRLEQEREEARQQVREQTDGASAGWGPGEPDWRGDSAGEPDLLSLLLRLARLLR